MFSLKIYNNKKMKNAINITDKKSMSKLTAHDAFLLTESLACFCASYATGSASVTCWFHCWIFMIDRVLLYR